MNTSAVRDNLPFLPSDLARPDQALVRAATARFVAFCRRQPAEAALDIARRSWPRDMTTELLVTRAAVSPTSTTTASVLASQAVAGFVASLSPQHAGARLIAAGLQVPLGSNSSVGLPGVATYPTAPFVAEGAAIPVAQAVLASATLGPASKLAIITSTTATLADVATQSVEAVLGALMRESAARALDSAIFSTTAGSSTRPAGLLAGVTPIAATSGGNAAALIADLRALIQGISDAGGGGNVWLFVNPSRAAVLPLIAGTAPDGTVVQVPSLAAGTVIAIDVAGFASGFTSEPEIDVARETVLHYEDTAPQGIGVSGSATLPIHSMWQEDLVAVRLILRTAWTMRSTGLVQFITGATW